MAAKEGAPPVAGRNETLIFDTPEEGRGFLERAGGRMRPEGQPGVRPGKESIAEEVAQEFEKEGEAVDLVRHPWEHTQAEHAEVQELVNTAFGQNLRAAIKKARDSRHYPRNLDLLHDVLTTEMYELVKKEDVNRQAVGVWVLAIGSVIIFIFLIIALLIAF